MDNGNREPEYLTIVLCFVLALFGGTARELAKTEENFKWRRFFSNLVTSGFCGLLIGLFAPDFEHKNWILICAGIAGFGGTQFLEFCTEVLKSAIRNSLNVKDDSKHND